MPKSEIEMARDGEFLREYGKQYFVVCSEALSIGRVKWSMVPIGKKGQDELTFYMPVEKMLALCLLFQDGTAQKKIAADAASYPSAFHYVTGENGSRILNIGGGKVGCRINVQNKDTNKNYMMAVSMESLEFMARKFLQNTGYLTTAPGSYYASVIAAFEEGRNKRAKYSHKVSDDELSEPSAAIDDTPAAPAPAKNDVVNLKSHNKTAKAQEYNLTLFGEKKAQKNFWRFDAKLGNESVSLLFNQADTPNIPGFDSLEKAAKQPNGVNVTLFAERRDNFLLYQA